MAKGHSNADNSTMAQIAENLETNARDHGRYAVDAVTAGEIELTVLPPLIFHPQSLILVPH
jgi:hypothetical protein